MHDALMSVRAGGTIVQATVNQMLLKVHPFATVKGQICPGHQDAMPGGDVVLRSCTICHWDDAGTLQAAMRERPIKPHGVAQWKLRQLRTGELRSCEFAILVKTLLGFERGL